MPGGVCHHSTGGDSRTPKRVCGQPADAEGLHAVHCKTGGAPYAAHSQGCNVLYRASCAAGYQSRREQVVPELATTACAAPQLDVEGWGLHGQARLFIDFSIRHPFSSHCSIGQDATALAEKEKGIHYTSRQGLRVRTAAMETYGRHGAGMVSLLETLADSARQRDRAFGHVPQRWLRRWRIQLSAIAARLVGRAVSQDCPQAA